MYARQAYERRKVLIVLFQFMASFNSSVIVIMFTILGEVAEVKMKNIMQE